MAAQGRTNGLVLTLSAVAATALTRRVVTVAWVAATGKPTMDRVDDPDNDLRDALAFAAFSGAVAGVIHMVVNRRIRSLMG